MGSRAGSIARALFGSHHIIAPMPAGKEKNRFRPGGNLTYCLHCNVSFAMIDYSITPYIISEARPNHKRQHCDEKRVFCPILVNFLLSMKLNDFSSRKAGNFVELKKLGFIEVFVLYTVEQEGKNQ